MRSLSILILGLFITASAFAQSDQSVRKEVEKAAATYAENYGKQNGAGMAALYARDGMLVVRDNRTLKIRLLTAFALPASK